MSDLEAKN